MSGWIKYHRSIENWEWYEDAYTLKLFLHIISNANIEDKRWKGIEIKRGQLVTSLDKLSERTHMTKKRVYKRLNDLVSSGEVTKEGTAFTLITVCKYETYQENGKPKGTRKKQKGNRKGTEKETTKEDKEDKEVKKFIRENISLKQSEIDTLKNKYKEKGAKWMVDTLSNYKLQSGKEYVSDYGALNGWVAKKYKEEVKANGNLGMFGQKQLPV